HRRPDLLRHPVRHQRAAVVRPAAIAPEPVTEPDGPAAEPREPDAEGHEMSAGRYLPRPLQDRQTVAARVLAHGVERERGATTSDRVAPEGRRGGFLAEGTPGGTGERRLLDRRPQLDLSVGHVLHVEE